MPHTGPIVFICYARADERGAFQWCSRVRDHLGQLEKLQDIEIFADQEIQAGAMWDKQIKHYLDHATVAVLLISPAFLNSDYIRDRELPVLLTRAREEGTILLPLILHGVALKHATYRYPDPRKGPEMLSLAEIQAVNAPGRPMAGMSDPDQEATFVDLVNKVQSVCEAAVTPVHSHQPSSKSGQAAVGVGSRSERHGTRSPRSLQNALAVLATVSLAITAYLNWEAEWYEAVGISLLLCLIVGAGLLSDLLSAKDRSHSIQFDLERNEQLSAPFRVDHMAGVYGGIIAGLVGGLITALAYQLGEQPDDLFSGLFARIVAAAAFTGFVLGLLCRIFIVWFAFLSERHGRSRFWFNEFTGGMGGGLVTGALMGLLLGWSFGQLPGYGLISTNALFFGALVGSAALTVTLRLYDVGYLASWIVRDFFVLVMVGVLIAGLGLLFDQAFGIYELIELRFYDGDDSTDLMLGGLVFGLLAGGVIGIVIGIDVILQRWWHGLGGTALGTTNPQT